MTSDAEAAMLFHLRIAGLPEPLAEFVFAPPRKFRADFAYPEQRLLIEVEGGVYQIGRHQRPAGFEKDCEKYNLAALLGYRVLRFTPAMIERGEAIETITKAMDYES
jgi:very-short-patch-repair endonuclease